MCGINGIVSWTRNTTDIVNAMNRHLGHRGPDGDGIFQDGPVALGHVRLSILDLSSAGAQPMKYNHWILTFNGEIYNFRKLRQELQVLGYHFNSRSDSEVLLKAWDCWGRNCLNRLEGMFAFAILNTQEKCIYLCRDGYGVKPLLYCHTHNEFLFASELKTLSNVQPVRPLPDFDALSTFLALHYVPAPQTGLLNCYKLQAGHFLSISFRDNQLNVDEQVKWHSTFYPKEKGVRANIDDLDKALTQSVRNQMVSDVPVGAFLSGGVDSSLICHYATQIHKGPLQTFSIGFSDAGSEYDETNYAALAAQIIGAQHHAVQVQLTQLSDRIDNVLDHLGDLNADTSVFLNHIISEEAKKYVTVCLSGAGGDELFGGYFRHQALLGLTLLKKIPKPLIKTIQLLLRPLPQNRDSRAGNLVRRLLRFLEQGNAGENDFISMLRQDLVYPQKSNFLCQEPVRTLTAALAFDFRYFLGENILSFSDKMSMLHGLEIRVPFLDPGVIKIAECMHNDQRVTLQEKKILLKRVAARYFPKQLIYRKKQGFAAPLEVWMRTLTSSELKKRCLGEVTSLLVSPQTIELLIRLFLEQKRDLSLQLYALIVLNRWANSNV